MTPEELTNIAYQEEIEIEPTSHIPVLNLIQNTYGPFTPLSIHRVPIFLALILKQTGQCRIRLPLYYEPDYLLNTIAKETESEDYQSIHPHFFECVGLVKDCYNVEDVSVILKHINDIKHIRYNKTSIGILNLDSEAVNLNNITPWEFSEIRVFMLKTMEEAKRLEKQNNENNLT